ncbi:MAG TPA: methyltransferase domain-containing protein [Humibacillus xanthopallidus]|nr:methyltransferase domain-containing protein [Humibacillus xanthopallidus]
MQCDYFDAHRCRSCALMGVPYAVQLADKQQHCAAVLSAVAPEVRWLDAFASPESGFRNKAKLVVGGEQGAVTLGILDASGRGVDLRDCGLYEPGLHELVPRLAHLVDELGLEPYDVPSRRGELKHLIVTHSPAGAVMLRFVLRSQKQLALLRSRLTVVRERVPEAAVVSVNLQPEHKAVLEGDTELVLTDAQVLPMEVNEITLGLRPNSFFQTNTAVAAGLYRQAQQWFSSVQPRQVLDLYCGVGGFALHAAVLGDGGPAEVVGIEVSPEAVASAEHTAEALRAHRRGMPPTTFRVGDATDVAGLDLLEAGSLVVVNPPRRGIGSDLAGWLEGSGAAHVVYSSCNVESLARDLALLPTYTARSARLFDMFPQTRHHEVMVLLERGGSQQHSAARESRS